MPKDPDARIRYWLAQSETMRLIGGTGPKRLKEPITPIDLPRIIHVHVDQGLECDQIWPMPLGIYAKNAVLLGRAGCPISLDYLNNRNLPIYQRSWSYQNKTHG